MRIVSLVPSLSELVAQLGLADSLVGVTSFCMHPPQLTRTATVVGGTKDASLALIASLQASHILVNREENTPELIAGCRGLAAVCETMPLAPADVPPMVRELGSFLACEEPCTQLANAIVAAQQEVKALATSSRVGQALAGKRYLYYIWTKPWMVASTPTYIEGMLALLGLVNAAPPSKRYPELAVTEAAVSAADLLCFSSEPWPFRQRDAARLRRAWPAAPGGVWADGRLLSWYGSSTLTALQAMQALLRGEAHALFRPLGAAAEGSVAHCLAATAASRRG